MTTKILLLSLIGLALRTAGYAQTAAPSNRSMADSTAAIVGQWSGTFEGASSGKFEMSFQADSSTHQLGGQLTVILGDGNRYSTTFKKVVFTNNQLTASYTEPDDGSTVTLSGQLAGPVLKGDWTVVDGQGKGSWQAIHPLR